MEKKWWQEAIVYQVYPRSFQDSNDDGIGDIRGIIQRLPYLKTLGIDVIWLSPIYQSPNDDNGYDISDYQAIQPEYGTMADFNTLLKEAHRLGLKLMMDLVVNHTSDEHFWFKESRKAKDNPYRDYYIWKDAKNGEVPNNWASDFGGSAWAWDAVTQQYYLHLFSKKQPDLNWDNPKVRAEIYQMMTWWLEKGVDGFRMDVINLISKDQKFPNDPNVNYQNHSSSMEMAANGPKVHHYLKEMNEKVLSKFDIITVGETPGVTIEEAKLYAGFESNELQMIFQFEHAVIDDSTEGLGKWSNRRADLVELKQILSKWQIGLHNEAWNSLYWNNHDRPRVVSRFGNDNEEYHNRSAKMLASTLHFMQGTPYIFQGEEIGMTNVAFDNIEDYQDLDTLNAYQDLVVEQKRLTHDEMLEYIHHSSRDNARTPMQWNNQQNAGFTNGRPWLEVNPNYDKINVEKALFNPTSIYYYYQKINQLRKEYPIIVYGDYELIDPDNSKTFVYRRKFNNQQLLVISNFTEETLETDYCNFDFESSKRLISNYSDDLGKTLRPYESKVYLIND
ncbi:MULTISPECIES: alpha-glucosidase [unclassified Enterococcus]|uniref:glycoside hydrolase family 13 protein n=1 Tax=unclassified Enterococcus TaxID=2608891 RepID=UPI0015546E76|nr:MULTISPECIES: alpha-glucosidase [unclassified Enterococcus]MBS7577821.1 alpha-glucosidase [Enterococcus sp. MMGLQ5-2]MBS7585081.1 alpha-glucosidase [Enterococcus sp. MMGLQ5-1]NPD12937.1 alpha-glucosidase [Enterococcus sp. MMGLQ5-1]NPD37651.1 alpha-glucosidase [Enterococcus sp. MMGLQ5-2]